MIPLLPHTLPPYPIPPHILTTIPPKWMGKPSSSISTCSLAHHRSSPGCLQWPLSLLSGTIQAIRHTAARVVYSECKSDHLLPCLNPSSAFPLHCEHHLISLLWSTRPSLAWPLPMFPSSPSPTLLRPHWFSLCSVYIKAHSCLRPGQWLLPPPGIIIWSIVLNIRWCFSYLISPHFLLKKKKHTLECKAPWKQGFLPVFFTAPSLVLRVMPGSLKTSMSICWINKWMNEQIQLTQS